MASPRRSTEVRRKTGTSFIADSKAEAVAELMLEVPQCFFWLGVVISTGSDFNEVDTQPPTLG